MKKPARRAARFHNVLLLLVFLIPTAHSQVNPGSINPGQIRFDENTIGISRFHKVNDHLYRGSLPSPHDLQALSSLGITTILDLRPANEKTSNEEHDVTALGMHYISLPMHGFSAPSQEQIERGLKVLQDARNWPVYVHCQYGVDRTGTLIACYRIQVESWSNQKAKEEAEQVGMHRFERGMKAFILQFKPE